MTQREITGAIKAFKYGILKAKESNRYSKEQEETEKADDTIKAEIAQRQADIARGEAYGVAQALALIGGMLNKNKYADAIYHELGE